MRGRLAPVVALVAVFASAAGAQTGPEASGPAGPMAPDTVMHDERGRATIRAVRITEPLRLDGRLDEEVYQSTRPIDGFL